MKINIKNNSSETISKVNWVSEFIKFCQSNYPLKSKIDLVLVDSSNTNYFANKYIIALGGKNLNDIFYEVSNTWVDLFSTERKIKCVNGERELCVKFFVKNNPKVQNELYI